MEIDIETKLRSARTALDGLSSGSSKSDILQILTDHAAVGSKLTRAEKAKLLAEFKSRSGADAELSVKMFNFLFNCTVKSKDMDTDRDKLFPGAGLVKIAESIDKFPDEVLPKVWNLEQMSGMKMTGGAWGDGTVDAQVGMEDVTGTDDHVAFSQDYLNANVDDQALFGAKNFDVIVKHEIGHGVDEALGGASATLLGSANGGEWIAYGTLEACLGTLAGLVDGFRTEFDAAIGAALPTPDLTWTSTSTGEWTKILGGCATALESPAELAKKVAATVGGRFAFPGVANFGKKKELVISKFPAGNTLVKLLVQGGRNQAWANWGSDPLAHGGRVYQFSGNVSGWSSFNKTTYAKRVSMYQYYTPSEWFAEFYTALNNDSSAVRAKAIGAYGNAAKWFKEKGIALYPDEIE